MPEENKSQPGLVNPNNPEQPPIAEPVQATPGLGPTSNNNSVADNAQPTNPPAQVSVANQPPAQDQFIIYGENEASTVKKPRNSKLWLRLVIAGTVLVVVLLVGYLFIVPSIWASSYQKAIKIAYNQQSNQIGSVYKSITNPVFNSTVSKAQEDQELQSIKTLLATATTNTNTLSAKDHLKLLPGTDWQHSISSANSEYQSMQKYVSDSQTFLLDYTELINYVQGFEQLTETKLQTLANNIGIINTGAQTSVFITDLQNAIPVVNGYSTSLSKLKPSPDLVQYNQSLINDLSSVSSALSTQASDLQEGNQAGFDQEKAIYITAYGNFAKDLFSQPLSNLNTNSILHTQMTILQAEHPLQ